jgi:DNA-binding SARP family transcriptional activator
VVALLAHAPALVPATGEPPGCRDVFELDLLDCCALRRNGQPVAMKSREQRLVALLGLHGSRSRSRAYLAGQLWPDVTETRAAGSLRATVWQLDRTAPGLLCHGGAQLALNPTVEVDVQRLTRLANHIIMLSQRDLPAGVVEDGEDCLELLLSGELLSGWYEDWVLRERERLQELRISALEGLAELLMDAGQVINALTAALAATVIDPLRESAQRAVIRIQLANGNYHAAVRQYLGYRRDMLGELGIGPSVQMERLIRPVMDRSRLAGSARPAPAVAGAPS